MNMFRKVFTKQEATIKRSVYRCGHYVDSRWGMQPKKLFEDDRIFFVEYNTPCHDCEQVHVIDRWRAEQDRLNRENE